MRRMSMTRPYTPNRGIFIGLETPNASFGAAIGLPTSESLAFLLAFSFRRLGTYASCSTGATGSNST